MTEKKTKNDRAWEIIFEEQRILDHIDKDGYFRISSTIINEQREARLMTKFDRGVGKLAKNSKTSAIPENLGWELTVSPRIPSSKICESLSAAPSAIAITSTR